MDDRSKRHKRSPNELVSQYRDIGIPAVAAAVRYQSRDRPGSGRRRQEKHVQQGPAAGDDEDECQKP